MLNLAFVPIIITARVLDSQNVLIVTKPRAAAERQSSAAHGSEAVVRPLQRLVRLLLVTFSAFPCASARCGAGRILLVRQSVSYLQLS